MMRFNEYMGVLTIINGKQKALLYICKKNYNLLKIKTVKTKSLLSVIVVLFCTIGFAQPGEIDNTFNSSGVGPYGGSPPPATQDGNADCLVYKSKVYASGPNKDKIIIIGRFTSYNGVARRYVARCNADGTLDTTFADPLAGTTGYLYCVEILSDGKILIGGVFSKTSVPSGSTIKNIARLNADGTLDNTFNYLATGTRGADGEVHALCVQDDGNILIGGAFTKYNGAGNRRVIRLLPTGETDPSFNGVGTVNAEVRALAIQNISGTKNILVGGFFTQFIGNTTYTQGKLVRLLPNGDYDTTYNATGTNTGYTGGDVYDIAVRSNGTFYAVGNFTQFNGQTRRSINFQNASGGSQSMTGTGLGTSGLNFIFSVKIQPDEKVLIGGNFTQVGTTTIPKGIARLTNVLTLDQTFLTGAGFNGGTGVYQGVSVIRDIVLQSDGKIIVAGDYTTYNGTSRRMLSRIKTRECSLSAIYNEATGWDGGVTPTSQDYYTAIVSGTLTIPSGTNYVACELDIKPGATLVIQPNASITVKGVVMNNGTFTIDDTGSLVQIQDNAVNADLGDGIFTMKRKTGMVKRYDFTYWSSPVEDITLYTVSPLTRYDKYFKYNANNWVTITNGNETMAKGRGYIMRAPENFSSSVAAQQEATFTGKPNNGLIESQPMTITGANKWNLIGNPYPSAISALAFLNDVDNTASLDGTIYIWTHQNDPSNNGSGVYVYSANDYITYNRTGGVLSSPTGVTTFNGRIAAGQAFFVQALQNNVTAKFKNAMRTSGSSNFYRQASTSGMALEDEENDSESAATDRFWLDLSNDQGAFNQILVGYLPDATDGFDRGYDGEKLSGYYVSFYSLLDDKNFTIQGRAPFSAEDVVPLGYYCYMAGSLHITLSNHEGLFAEQDVYLVDHLLNVTHNLKDGAYTFTSAAGTFNERFSVVYQSTQLSNPEVTPSENDIQVISSDAVSVRSTGENLAKVEVYDVLGKKLYESPADLDSQELRITSFTRQKQVLMVRVTLQGGLQTIRKTIY